MLHIEGLKVDLFVGRIRHYHLSWEIISTGLLLPYAAYLLLDICCHFSTKNIVYGDHVIYRDQCLVVLS